MNLETFAKESHQISLDHGFKNDNLDQRLMLIVDEISEAHEELRKGKDPQEVYYANSHITRDKPEGFGIELADAVIRILDLSEAYGLEIVTLLELKQAYNKTRPFKHGKKF